MAGLLDIAPVTETVTINGTAVTVTGVSAFGLFNIFMRFPQIRKMIDMKTVEPMSLMAIGNEATAAVIAAGTGEPGSAAHEAAAAKLPMEPQVDLLAAIIRVSLPNGPGPFVEKLTTLMKSVAVQSDTLPDMKLPKASKR